MGHWKPQSLALGGASANVSFRRRLNFDKQSFLKVLPLVYLGFAAIFAVATLLFDYELTQADIPGSLLSGAVIAFLIQYVMKNSGTESEN